MYETYENALELPQETGPLGELHETFEGGLHETPLQEIFHEAGALQESGELFESGEFGQELGQELGHELSQEVSLEALHEELALEFAGLQGEDEIDRFLGKALRRVVRSAGTFIRSPAGRLVTNVLRQAARRALPVLGTAVGGYFGGPLGAKLGGQLASFAGSRLGLEMGALSSEDRQMELSRQFARFAVDAIRTAANAPQTAAAGRVARAAIVNAARRHFPLLLQPTGRGALTGGTPGIAGGVPAAGGIPGNGVRGLRGTWVRRGRAIILYGA